MDDFEPGDVPYALAVQVVEWCRTREYTSRQSYMMIQALGLTPWKDTRDQIREVGARLTNYYDELWKAMNDN